MCTVEMKRSGGQGEEGVDRTEQNTNSFNTGNNNNWERRPQQQVITQSKKWYSSKRPRPFRTEQNTYTKKKEYAPITMWFCVGVCYVSVYTYMDEHRNIKWE